MHGFLEKILRDYTSYGDAGALLPSLHLVAGHKMCDLSTLVKAEQMLELAASELGNLPEDEKVLAIVEKNN